MSQAGSITVAVRVRPPTEFEASRLPEPTLFDLNIRGDGTLSSPRKLTNSSCVRNIVQVVDDRILTFDPPEPDIAKAFSDRGFVPPGSKRYKDRRFMFDRVFEKDATQIDVYENTTQPLLDGLLDGYNSTVFAYGATGCGKTFTISGSEGDPGIIYLAMQDLFQRIEDRKEEITFEVAVTFLEIYNEEIRDLLAEPGSSIPKGGLAIREDKHVKVANLTELRPSNADEVKEIVILGNRRRTQSPTHANETSSRSHAVLQVHVTQSPRTASTTETRTMATLSIIDLAGSERASATKNMGERMVEGANINKSLLALGNCINALCESGGATRHIPYRNSKLTRLLKFSLGGNCKTVMIVCVAPTSIHFEDTHNALVYAERATKIKTKVVTRNVLNVNRHVGQYVEAINRLNVEVAQLKAKLADRQSGIEELIKKRRTDMLGEISRADSDISLKSKQIRQSVGDGAKFKAVLDIAEMKVTAVQFFHRDDDDKSICSQSEKEILSDFLARQEEILRKESSVSSGLQKSENAENLFDAMLKAVIERRSVGKLDEVGLQNVQLLMKCAKAELKQYQAEESSKAYREVLEQQTRMLISLALLAAQGASMLRQSASSTGMPDLDTTCLETDSLRSFADATDQSIVNILSNGLSHTPLRSGAVQPTTSWNRRKTSVSNDVKPSKRFSILTASPKRSHRSPRKSRLSLSKSKSFSRREVEKKTVRWKEEVQISPSVSSSNRSSNAFQAVSSSQVRPNPSAGSESDWEDEKTEESLAGGILLIPSRGTVGQKRIRHSRLDPAFLRNKEPVLESLMESGDEEGFTTCLEKTNRSVTPNLPTKKPRLQGDQRLNSMTSRPTRRISSIGPMRASRSRRRSSILMENRAICDENLKPVGGAEIKPSVARRKRSSVSRPLRPLTTVASGDLSGEASFRSIKPMWR